MLNAIKAISAKKVLIVFIIKVLLVRRKFKGGDCFKAQMNESHNESKLSGIGRALVSFIGRGL